MSHATSNECPPQIAPSRRASMSWIEGPRPSSNAAPSVWNAELPQPKAKSAGKWDGRGGFEMSDNMVKYATINGQSSAVIARLDTAGMMSHPSARTYVRTYEGVRRREHHELLEAAVVRSGGRVLYSSGPDVAPLFLAVEDAGGARHGVMAYVFWANRKVTVNRPGDEHRLQIRYGDVNSPAWRAQHHPVGFDPTGLETTLVLGVDAENDLIVALDPLLYDPFPLGISVYWKDAEAMKARTSGWYVFERDNLSGIRRTERRAGPGLETVVMLAPERLFDLLRLERQAQALRLDPALRFRAAERIGAGHAAGTPIARHDLHQLEDDYELPATEILAIIAERARLAMAVRGGVAEHHAGRALRGDPVVAEAVVAHQEGPPDYWVTLKDGSRVSVEVKNASPRILADGTPKVEVQKTRASRADPLSRLYTPAAFDVLAACMYGPAQEWRFRYRRSALLTPHPKHPDRIAPVQRITPAWAGTLGEALAQR